MKQRKRVAYQQNEAILLQKFDLQRKEHFIPVKEYGLKVRVQEIGTGDPLVFIHGGPSAGSAWLELASLLPSYRCLILDRPGCGLSEGLSYRGITLKKLEHLIVSVIDSVLNYFDLGNSNFIGSSFGGYWAIKYAIKKPMRVEKMIQEGAPALVEGSTLPPFMKAIGNPFLKWMIPKLPGSISNSEKTLKEIGHAYSIENKLIADYFMEWYVNLWNNTDTIKHEFNIISKVVKKGKQNDDFILGDSEIAKLGSQSLWLWGKDDAFAGSEVARRITGKLKDSNLVEFEHAGHLPWLDNTKEHAKLINEFLSARESAGFRVGYHMNKVV